MGHLRETVAATLESCGAQIVAGTITVDECCDNYDALSACFETCPRGAYAWEGFTGPSRVKTRC